MGAGWNPRNKEVSSTSDRLKLHFPVLLPTPALRFTVQWDLGLPYLCVGLALALTTQTTPWPLCRSFSGNDTRVVSFSLSSQKLQGPLLPLLSGVVGTAQPGQLQVGVWC